MSNGSATDDPMKTVRTRPDLSTAPSSRPNGPLTGVQKLALSVGFFCFRAYMLLVRLTSRIDTQELNGLWGRARGGRNTISAILHQDVIISAFLYRGHRIVSMVSTSQDGDRITRVARKLGHEVVRGSGAQRGRRALAEMIDYLDSQKGVVAALTVDGSRGPANVCKRGTLLLAQQTGTPIIPIRTWARRHLSLRTWDRTMIPLPFNRIVALAGDPIFLDRDLHPDEMEEARLRVESELQRLTDLARVRAGSRG